MKRITAILEDDVVAATWLRLLDVNTVIMVLVEDIGEGDTTSSVQASPWSGPRMRKDSRPRVPGTSAAHVVADYFFGKGLFNNDDAAALLQERDYKRNSVNAALSRLFNHGFASKSLEGYLIKRKVPLGYSFERAERRRNEEETNGSAT